LQLILTRLNRIVALVLAAIWLAAGTLAGVLGVVRRRWLLIAVGIIAIWYGVLWIRVACKGRQLRWRETLWPWRER